MIRSRVLRSGLVCAAGILMNLSAQTEHVTPFTGTWKLDLAKSKFDPGPPFQNFTLTFTPDGVRHLYLTGADGKVLNATLPWPEGREVPVAGMEDTTVISDMEDRTFHDVWKRNGRVIENVHGAVSKDGRTLTTRVEGTDEAGRTFRNRLRFERE